MYNTCLIVMEILFSERRPVSRPVTFVPGQGGKTNLRTSQYQYYSVGYYTSVAIGISPLIPMPVVGQWRWIELERDQERGSVSEVQLPLTRGNLSGLSVTLTPISRITFTVAVLIFNYCPSRASVRACGRKYNRYRLHKGSGYHLYLQAELILLAVTRESESYVSYCLSLHTDLYVADFEDRGAHHIAKQHDPQGKRTIGMSPAPAPLRKLADPWCT